MKWFRIGFILIFVVLIAVSCVRFFSQGHTITYKLPEHLDFEILEVNTRKLRNERDNYYIEIRSETHTFSFQLFEEFDSRRIVTDIIYYEGDYTCLLPIFDERIIVDMLCYKDGIFYDYHMIQGEEDSLDKFVSGIEIYDVENWSNELGETTNRYSISLFTDNRVQKHKLAIASLRGVFEINENINEITLFTSDVYNRPLSAFVGEYYIVADYSVQRRFREFHLVNLNTRRTSTLRAPTYISFDSYIQGVVEEKVYLYDRNNELQYEIDINRKTIQEVGNARRDIRHYKNGDWTKISTVRANQRVFFNYTIEVPELRRFDYIFLQGNRHSGHHYLIEKRGNRYNVFRAHVQNNDSVKFLFQVDNINTLTFLDDFVYFIEDNEIRYYSDRTGVRTIIRYDELRFNVNLIFNAYK